MQLARQDAHVLVAAAGEVDDEDVFRQRRWREADGFRDGVRAFERGHNAFGAREHHGGVERLCVGGGGVGRRGRSRAARRAPGPTEA